MSKAEPRPLRIGISARLMHEPPPELGFHDKRLQYLEQSIAHWIIRHGALALMVPAIDADSVRVERRVKKSSRLEFWRSTVSRTCAVPLVVPVSEMSGEKLLAPTFDCGLDSDGPSIVDVLL